jgi:23S rRNA pseudouridine2604 synthase
MVQLGLASRREADEWIARGWVRVDDKVVATLGARVQPEQRVSLDARARNDQMQRVTILLHKPPGHVSGQAEDGHEPAIALIKPKAQWRGDASGQRFEHVHLRGIAPAGRLDLESTGLLVFTQDGRIAKQLIGEDSEVEKEYLVRVERAAAGAPADHDDAAPSPDDEALALLRHGIELDGEPLKPAAVDRLEDGRLRFVLRQGKKRQIRRMCEAVGLKVTALERVRIGGVLLGDLPAGEWRYLRDDESFV